MSIEAIVKVPLATEENLKSRQAYFQELDDSGADVGTPIMVKVDPITAPTVKGLLVKGKNYSCYFTSTDQAGNESVGANRITFLAADTKAPDPDAAPELVSLNEVPDAPTP